ncbi:MAG: cytochrome b/b6 domain-containing protein [Desulfohalobiaceae bacterium]|nr:cytochrome b/b6 domain-containing protein [Desulfohalobiaceae bacterium]
MNNGKNIYLYTRFERFWHWAQGILIILLMLSGFEIHGLYTLFGFETAFGVHNFCAWTWLILYAFILFWMAITAEWKQYIPTFQKLFAVMWYYLHGIFKGEPHPVPKTTRAKHNPLQRLTYLGIVTFLVPFQLITGYMYYYYNAWPSLGWDWALQPVALLHTAGGFAMLTFFIVHIYMTTTGHTWSVHIKSMFTGWEEVESTAGHEWEAKG